MIELCVKIPQLDGSQGGCSVAQELSDLSSLKNGAKTRDITLLCDITEAVITKFTRVCSKCIITKALEVARNLWPCERCLIRPTNSKKVYKLHPCHNCTECHGIGISREAFQKEPLVIIKKLVKFKGWSGDTQLDWEAYLQDRESYRVYKGQFFQLFWLWEQLRLTGEAGGGKEE